MTVITMPKGKPDKAPCFRLPRYRHRSSIHTVGVITGIPDDESAAIAEN